MQMFAERMCEEKKQTNNKDNKEKEMAYLLTENS